MTTTEFKAIVDDAVKNGANRADAEAYVRRGYKLADNFGKSATAPAAKKPSQKKGVRK